MDMKIELVPLPVTDIDRAKEFYTDVLGFHVDVDIAPADNIRFVQLTPQSSVCSISIGTGIPGIEMAPPGSVRGLHLVVGDIAQAREQLQGRDLEVGDIVDVGHGVKYAAFSDPDGNSWVLQEMPWRSAEFDHVS
jgi:catechol 2,3-dioxygenase-like lactoylglutathione lyase family enzyme